MNKYKNYFINLICPAFVFGSITGILTAIIVTIYKLCAKYVINMSERGYELLRSYPYLIPIVLAALFGVAFGYALCYKKLPNIRGGGIPMSIGILRGLITFKWLRNLIGTFTLSLATFLIGVPLGNEGPSVQIGTAIGRGSVLPFSKKHRAWDRYSMTGGACAGFSTATGAPISGIMFAIEEAHQRISPMIIIVSCVSVMFARLTTELISPIVGVSVDLFPEMSVITLKIRDIWIPLVVGIAMGLLAVLFLKLYKLINTLINKKLKHVPRQYKIFVVFALTLILGVVSYSFISTGHHLILELFNGNIAIYMLVLILLARAVLTICANSSSITGGIFLPILSLGALLSSLLGRIMQELFGISQEYYTIILILGITACISSMMKTPLTAIFFAVEALSCYNNIVYVIAVSAIAFVITEIFEAKSIPDTVLDTRIEEQNDGKEKKVIDTFVTVQKNAFAIGKQIRDIFWPSNLFVLSLKHDETKKAEVDEHGGKEIREGDLLHVRYSTFDEVATREELFAIVGEQSMEEKEADVI